MKRYLPTIIFVLVFMTGFSVMAYPTVSDYINRKNQSRVISKYDDSIAGMTPEDYSKELAAAHSYNEYIAGFDRLGSAVYAEEHNPDSPYMKLLDVGQNGVMGVIMIPSINVSMPIYHTTEETVLQTGAGHYIGSSLPVGGAGTHSILTGHRGLPSAKLFTDLDQVKAGDQFYIKVLGDVLAYQVDQIKVVLPEELGGLSVVAGEDYVTLVTCTPYGINSHRMLIRGTRIPYTPEEVAEHKAVQPDVSPGEQDNGIDKIPFIAAAILIVFCIMISRLKRNKKTHRTAKMTGQDGANHETKE